MKKKVNIVVSFFFLFYCLLGNGIGSITTTKVNAAVTPEIQISLPDKVYVSDSFEVVISINNAEDLYGASLDLVFDPKVVSIEGVTRGNIFSMGETSASDLVKKFSNIDGTVTYAVSFTGDVWGVKGSGSLFILNCKAVGAGDFKWNVTQKSLEKLELPASTARILLSDSSVRPVSYTISPASTRVILDNTPPSVSADVKTGLYNSSKSVALTALDDYDSAPAVYYTLDGSTPTASSTRYNSPIIVDKTSTLKFIGVDNRGNKSEVFSEQYTIDKVAPAVSGLDPSDKAFGVNLNKKIVVSFSENLKEGSAFSGIALIGSNGQVVPSVVTITGKVLEIVPKAALSYGTTYTVSIPAGAANDLAGNSMASNFASSFQTLFMLEDLDKNNMVDVRDIAIAAQKYRLRNGQAGWDAACDLNGDNIIDIFDLVKISRRISN